MKKPWFFLFFISIFALTAQVNADVKSAQLAIDVPAGKWKSVRLKNLPENASIKIDVRSDRAVTLTVVDEANYRKYPKVKRPLLQSRVVNTFSFTVKIPSTGDYYIVFDNISGVHEARLDVKIVGASGTDSVLL